MTPCSTTCQSPTAVAVERLLEWTEPARRALGIDLGDFDPTGPNGTQRMRSEVDAGAAIAEAYRTAVDRTAASYLAAG